MALLETRACASHFGAVSPTDRTAVANAERTIFAAIGGIRPESLG